MPLGSAGEAVLLLLALIQAFHIRVRKNTKRRPRLAPADPFPQSGISSTTSNYFGELWPTNPGLGRRRWVPRRSTCSSSPSTVPRTSSMCPCSQPTSSRPSRRMRRACRTLSSCKSTSTVAGAQPSRAGLSLSLSPLSACLCFPVPLYLRKETSLLRRRQPTALSRRSPP